MPPAGAAGFGPRELKRRCRRSSSRTLGDAGAGGNAHGKWRNAGGGCLPTNQPVLGRVGSTTGLEFSYARAGVSWAGAASHAMNSVFRLYSDAAGAARFITLASRGAAVSCLRKLSVARARGITIGRRDVRSRGISRLPVRLVVPWALADGRCAGNPTGSSPAVHRRSSTNSGIAPCLRDAADERYCALSGGPLMPHDVSA